MPGWIIFLLEMFAIVCFWLFCYLITLLQSIRDELRRLNAREEQRHGHV